MKPSAVAVDFGTPDLDSPPRTSFDFEEVPYPADHWSSRRQEELPLHYMQEEKARRRVVRGPGGLGGGLPTSEQEHYDEYDDNEGKDVYHKTRYIQGRLGSGRLPQHPLPPPTSIVSLALLGDEVQLIVPR